MLSATDEKDLMKYYQLALEGGLSAQMINYAGKTVVKAGPLTCIGIGPALNQKIDTITGHLQLVK